MSNIDELSLAFDQAPECDSSLPLSKQTSRKTNKSLSTSEPRPSTSQKKFTQNSSKQRKSIQYNSSSSESDSETDSDDTSSSESEETSDSAEGEILNNLSVTGFDPSSFLGALASQMESKYQNDNSDDDVIDFADLGTKKKKPIPKRLSPKKISPKKSLKERKPIYSPQPHYSGGSKSKPKDNNVSQELAHVGFNNHSYNPYALMTPHYGNHIHGSITFTRQKSLEVGKPSQFPVSSTALALPNSFSSTPQSVLILYNRMKICNLDKQKKQLKDMLDHMLEEIQQESYGEESTLWLLLKLALKAMKTTFAQGSRLPRLHPLIVPVVRFDIEDVPNFEFYYRGSSLLHISPLDLIANVDHEILDNSKEMYELLQSVYPGHFF